ncbi:hypothetical protein D3C79_657450 [compost metagenome]
MHAPLAAVTGFVGAAIRHVAGGRDKELATGADHVAARQVAAYRRQFGALPFVLHVGAEGELRVEAVRGRELPHRQQHFLDLDARLRRLDGVGRVLHAIDAGVVQALAPGLDMPSGLGVQRRAVVETPTAEHIGVEQARAAAAVVAGVAGELVVVTVLVHGGRRVVVVLAVVHVVVEGTGAHHRAVVVHAQDHLAQRANAVGGQAALVEVAVGVIGVDPEQAVTGLAQAHADAVAGGHRPVDGRTVVELDGFPRPGWRGGQRDGRRQAGRLDTAGSEASTVIVVLVDHTDSPDRQPPGRLECSTAPSSRRW